MAILPNYLISLDILISELYNMV